MLTELKSVFVVGLLVMPVLGGCAAAHTANSQEFGESNASLGDAPMVVEEERVAAAPSPLPASTDLGIVCGVDIDAPMVTDALASLSDQQTTWIAGEASHACGSLGWVAADLANASGSAPNHILFFDQDRYLGPATEQPYPYSYVVSETADTVTVQYRWLNPGDALAVPTGGPVDVRYQLVDGTLEMLDELPPEVTGQF